MSKLLQPTKLYLLIIIAAIIMVYAQSLKYDFVNYDDYDLIYENSSFLSDPANIVRSFSSHAFAGKREESVYYRPLLQVSYIIDYRMWGLNPLGYRATNIILHILSTIILFFFISRFLEEKFLAFIGSMLFALHPIQVESVAWIAGRNDILLGLFVVLMIYFYANHHSHPNKKNMMLFLSILSFAAALFTKESAAFYILLLPAYDLISLKNRKSETDIRQFTVKVLPYIIVLFGYLLIRYFLFGELIGTEALYGKLSTSGRIRIAPALLTEHLSLLLFPVRLSVEHPLDQLIWLEYPLDIISYAVTAVLIISPFFLIRAQRHGSFGLSWIIIGFLPLLNFIPVAVPILEHRLYTVTAGYIILLMSCTRIFKKEKYFRSVKIIFVLILAAYALGSYTRIPVWKDSESLWLDAIAKAPMAHRSYFNLAGHYYDRQQYEKSLALVKKYIELKPEDLLGYSKLRQIYYVMGQTDQSIAVCREMINLDPENQNRYLDLGLLFENLNMTDSAIIFYREILNRKTEFYKIHDRIGTLFLGKNLPDSAEYHYKLSIKINREYASPYFNLGMLFHHQGNDTTALSYFSEGLKYGKPPTGIGRVIQQLQVRR